MSIPVGESSPALAVPVVGASRQATMLRMTGEDEETALVSAAARGDREAFAELHGRYARVVHGILISLVPFAEAHDLVQDVFLLALRKLDSLREAGAFGGWIVTIARNRARDHVRRRAVAQDLPDELPARDSTCDPEAAEALAAIRELPEAYREPLILRLVEGLSGPEIAARCGLTPGSVRVNLHRGMKHLRERLLRRSPHE